MNFQTQHDLIDPDVPAPEVDEDVPAQPGAPDDAYLIRDGVDPARSTIIVTTGKPKKAAKPWVKPAAFALCAAFVGLTAWNVMRMTSGPAPLPPPTPFQVKQALYLGVAKVDMYRRAHGGVTPTTIEDMDLPQVSYDYRRVDAGHYVLGFHARDGQTMQYDSNIPKETVFGSPQAILSMGVTR